MLNRNLYLSRSLSCTGDTANKQRWRCVRSASVGYTGPSDRALVQCECYGTLLGMLNQQTHTLVHCNNTLSLLTDRKSLSAQNDRERTRTHRDDRLAGWPCGH